MESLKDRLLSSIENHGKSDLSGIYKLYPHEKKISILRSLFHLKNEGWVKLRKTRTQGGGIDKLSQRFTDKKTNVFSAIFI